MYLKLLFTLSQIRFRITLPVPDGETPICPQYAAKLLSSIMTTGARIVQVSPETLTEVPANASNPPRPATSLLMAAMGTEA